MKIFVNVESRQLQESVGVSRMVSTLAFKRGDGASVEIIFVRDGVQVELTSGSIVTFGAKLSGKYDANALVLENGFTLTGSGTTASYVGAPSFNTEDLDAALEKDGDDTNDVPYLDLMGEISWTDGPTGEPTSTDTFTVRVNNDVLRGDEVGPIDITEGTPVNEKLTITGTLTSNGTTPVTFPFLYKSGTQSGKSKYQDSTGQYISNWDGSQWTVGSNDTPEAYWTSSENVSTPDLVVTWTPASPATGTPTVAKTAATSGRAGSMRFDEDFQYLACSFSSGSPFWKKIALSAL